MRAKREPTGHQAFQDASHGGSVNPQLPLLSERLSLSAFSDTIFIRPGGGRPPTAGADRPEQQQDEPGGGAPVVGGEAREPLAWARVVVRECRDPLRPGGSAVVVTAIVPD